MFEFKDYINDRAGSSRFFQWFCVGGDFVPMPVHRRAIGLEIIVRGLSHRDVQRVGTIFFGLAGRRLLVITL